MMRLRTAHLVTPLTAGLLAMPPLAVHAAGGDDLPTARAREARDDAADLRADRAESRSARTEALTLTPPAPRPFAVVGLAHKRAEDRTSTTTTPFSFGVRWPDGVKLGLYGDGYRHQRSPDTGAKDGLADVRVTAGGKATEDLSWKASVKVPTAGAVGSASASQKVSGAFTRQFGDRWTTSVHAELARSNAAATDRSRFTRTALAELSWAAPGAPSWTGSLTRSVRRGAGGTTDLTLEHTRALPPAGWEAIVSLNRGVAGASRDAEIGLRLNRKLH